MLGILRYIRKFLLSALNRHSPIRLLQYLLALCRAVFSRCQSKCSQDSSHEPLPKTLTAEEKESLPEESLVNPVGHVISASRTPAQIEEGFPPTRNYCCEHPPREDVCIRSNPLLKRGFLSILINCPSLFSMVYMLDHPGFIQRSLAHTQIEDTHSPTDTVSQNNSKVVWSTEVKKWSKFSHTYAEDIREVGLLATVLLGANMNFLAIQSIDNEGLSYLPQRFSYLSLLAALASIVMGSAVRSPRLFTNHGPFYFQAMTLILGFPFELFLYSILFFLLALLTHCVDNKAVVQLVVAGIFAVLMGCCFIAYWLITEPCNDIDSLHHRHQKNKGRHH